MAGRWKNNKNRSFHFGIYCIVPVRTFRRLWGALPGGEILVKVLNPRWSMKIMPTIRVFRTNALHFMAHCYSVGTVLLPPYAIWRISTSSISLTTVIHWTIYWPSQIPHWRTLYPVLIGWITLMAAISFSAMACCVMFVWAICFHTIITSLGSVLPSAEVD